MTTYKKPPLFFVFLLLILIAGTGLWLSRFVGEKMRLDEENNLLLRAQMIAVMLDRDDVRALDGDERDLDKPAYDRLKLLLEEVRALNVDSRFIYIMGLNDKDQQFFNVDSEPADSEDYSAPGDLYLEATPLDIANHKAGIAYTDGPYTDSWGEWVSAYAPIFSSNQNVLGLVGIDVAAERIVLRIKIVKQAILLIFGLLFYITLVLILHRRRILR